MMNNKYIKIVMEPTKNYIGGSFNTVATFKLDNVTVLFKNVPVKIDTGCSVSTIPLARFKMIKQLCRSLKEQDINNNVPYLISYGVETGTNIPQAPKTYEDKLQSKALKFKHDIDKFTIAGVQILNKTIYVNYDRTGTILIGMDILKDWDIHMGTILASGLMETGKTIFLACPKLNINQDYLFELERLFGIGAVCDTINNFE